MPRFSISPGKTLCGNASIPSSKSHTLRAILFATLAEGESHIDNVLDSPDTLAMINACQQLGAVIHQHGAALTIQGVAGKPCVPDDVIDAGNSGQVLRFIGAIAGLIDGATVITGDESVRHNRPAKPLLDGLNQLGANAFSTRGDNKAPIVIQGPMHAGTIHIDGQDSQPVSGLLIASQFLTGRTEIFVDNPGEKPWLNLTLEWFKRLGLDAESSADFSHFVIEGGAKLKAFDYVVPGDFSSLAFPVAAALLTQSEITLHGVDMNDTQGDKAFLDALMKMGATFNYSNSAKTLTVHRCESLQGVTLDINDYIDAITILAVIGCYTQGETVIKNAAIARQKECDRIASITTELKKMGADIQETDDGLIIKHSQLRGATVHSHHDHRMAMSLTVAGLIAGGQTNIENIECVKKTFPNFVELMKSLGADIKVCE